MHSHSYELILLSGIFVSLMCITTDAQSGYEAPHKKFEYKYSFKGPYLAQKDGVVPFWEYEGNTMASDDMVRITPSLRSKRGSIWTKYKTGFEWWEAEVWLRVTGRGRLGADGVAFWFVDQKLPEGPVFGVADNWRGLGVFFDSFDNDGKGNNPYIMAMVNDGTKSYDHNSDGSSQQIGGCLRDFRNKPFPVKARIEYYKNILTIMIHSGNSNNDDDYEMCIRAENVHLPQFGQFGLSGATGGLADDHDALKFLTSSLHPPGTMQTAGVPDAEKEKVDKEFEAYKADLERKKEQWKKEHPDAARDLEHESADDAYDTLSDKELQQIFQTQTHIWDSMKNLNRKLDEILGRQERTLSVLSSATFGQVAHPAAATGGQVPPGVAQLPIARHEVEAILGANREMLQSTRDIRTAVVNQANGNTVPASMQNAGQQNPLTSQLLTEIRDGVNVLRKEIAVVGTKFMSGSPQGQHQCPPVVSCVSNGFFVTALAAHLILTVGYFIYKSNQEKKHGKFY